MPDNVSRPRLLFLCHTLPYPPDGGPWIRSFHVLRLLARAFKITALCFERSPTAGAGIAWDLAAGRKALGRHAEVEVFPIPQAHSRSRWAWDHARSTTLAQVYTTYLYRSRQFRRRLRELLTSRSFDLVHIDSFDLSGYLPECRSVPVVCGHHDIQSSLLRRRAAVDARTLRRAYVRYQAALMAREERRWCGRVALNVAVSDRDAALLRQLVPAARVAVVPNGVDVNEFRASDDKTTGGIAFAGGAVAFPNPQALEFFCTAILPHLRASTTDLPVRWIGRATPEQQQHYAGRYGIHLTGYVEDVRPLMQEAACHVVPLTAGGGTRLKILNSWAMGKPVVSTSIGCEGLAAVDGENILIRDEPAAFAQAVVQVLSDERLRNRLGAGGRATVERLYSWDIVGERMRNTYLDLAREHAQKLFSPCSAISGVPYSLHE
jgi:glycosyltransferase involved in cell wall biosynthesis